MLQFLLCMTAVAGGMVFLLRWQLSREAPVALLGVVMLVEWLPRVPALGRVDWLFAVGLLAVAYALVRHPPPGVSPVARPLACCLTALAAAHSLQALSRVGWSALWVVSDGLALLALVVIAGLAVVTLRSALEDNALLLLGLRLRAESAEDVALLGQERLHQVQSAVTSVHEAFTALHLRGHGLDVGCRQSLEETVDRELGRLEALLTRDSHSPAPPTLSEDLR
jgi:hypothetical protein